MLLQLNEKKEILRRMRRCRKCSRCQGAHHQSVCTQGLPKISDAKKPGFGSKPDESAPKPVGSISREDDTVTANQISAIATRSKRKVFQQTATTYAYSPNKSSVVPGRVLMDSGRQRSYVPQSLKKSWVWFLKRLWY